jgi:hypothetical protein
MYTAARNHIYFPRTSVQLHRQCNERSLSAIQYLKNLQVFYTKEDFNNFYLSSIKALKLILIKKKIHIQRKVTSYIGATSKILVEEAKTRRPLC